LVPLQSGEFIVSSDERVTGQENSNALWRIDLPRTNIFPARSYATLVMSRTGGTLFVISDRDKDTQIVEVYRPPEVSTKTKFAIPYQSLISRLAASDAGLLYMNRDSPDLTFVDRLGGARRRVWTCQSPWQCALHPQFVGANQIIFDDSPHSLVLLDDTGAVIQKRQLGKETIGRISASSGGTRIMVMLLKTGGGSTFFDMFPKVKEARIAILDTSTLGEVASLAVDPKHVHTIHAGISSTGDLVAYIDNGVLKFWHITSPPIAK
jgi:hypothetical protein